MSEIKAQIQAQTVAAMKGGDKARLAVLRGASAAIKQIEIDERVTLDDTRVIAVIDKLCKQRRESAEQFRAAGREDLLATETYELGVLQAFLPAALDPAEIEAAIDAAVRESGASTVRDMGKVMSQLKTRLAGRADMAAVSAQVKARLGG